MLMDAIRVLAWVVGICVPLALLACSRPTATETIAPQLETPQVRQTQAISASGSEIKEVDFENFTPPRNSCSQKIEVGNGVIRLIHETPIRQGRVGATFINYGDVTRDGKEDALVVVAVETAGSAIPYCAYVYAAGEKEPKLVWSFLTGDRADDGLRQLYAAGQQLVVELYSPEDSRGACCPTKYIRITYTWNGNKFLQTGTPELLPLSKDEGAAPIMPKYSKPST